MTPLAERIRVADAHNDLLLELDYRRDEETPFARHWLPVLEAGGVALQVCPSFTAEPEWLPERCLRLALQQVAAFHRAVDENPDRVRAVVRRSDLDAVERGERMGLLLSMEGADALGQDPALFDVFWRLGVRMVSLTHNPRNAFADGLGEPNPGGLSNRGRELVERLARLGCAIDVSHASEATFDDIVAFSGDAPLLASHACCRAVYDTPRNLSDAQLRHIVDRGGVLGIMLLPFVVDPERPTLERVLDHVDHAVEVMGVEHVAIGGDFIRQVADVLGLRPPTGGPGPAADASPWVAVEDVDEPDGYPRLLDAMARRGYAPDDVRAIAGGNLLRFLRRVLPE